MSISSEDLNNKKILQYLHHLEWRISNIESRLKINWKDSVEEIEIPKILPDFINKSEEKLELRIGENWFAKFGIAVLALGVIFLLTLPYKDIPPYLPTAIGYVLSAVLISVSVYLKASFNTVSRYLFGGALLLFYFSTMRLHYFSEIQAIENKLLTLILLFSAVIINIALSIKRHSIYLVTFNLVFLYLTVLLSNDNQFVFLSLILLSAGTVVLSNRLKWEKLLVTGIVLTYLTYFFQIIGNPAVGGKLELTIGSHYNSLYILFYMIIFAAAFYFKDRGSAENAVSITSSFMNTFFSYSLFLLTTLKSLPADDFYMHYLASVVFLLLSILFWQKYSSKYLTFFYSIFGYTALSVAIILQFYSPDFFIVLSWQSLIVISTAVWFRSKIIIVANFLIFIIIFISFLILAGKVSLVSLSFGVVALISARILNWKKERLDLKTELMRNSYLATAFVIIPFSIYHSFQSKYFILALIGITIFYYILSRILDNSKYRWMGHLTIILTVFYTLIVGTIELDPLYRVISFIVVGLVLIIISLVYTRSKTKEISKGDKEKDLNNKI